MPRLVVFSAKGGCGASLIAANLAAALARHGSTLLLDLHGPEGTADLLLDLQPPAGWTALLPVVHELGERHLQRAVAVHSCGLQLLGAPERADGIEAGRGSVNLLHALGSTYEWLVVDAPSGAWSDAVERSDHVLLVVTPDPPALRCARRLLGTRPEGLGAEIGLVVNQVGRGQPATPAEIAAGLGAHLLASVPSDPRSVGYQVHFGRACVLDRQSALGRVVAGMAARIAAPRVQRAGPTRSRR